MKLMRISLLLLLVAAIVVSGCKAAQEPVVLTDQTVSSEEIVENGLQELNEIDSLAEENDLDLDELEKLELK